MTSDHTSISTSNSLSACIILYAITRGKQIKPDIDSLISVSAGIPYLSSQMQMLLSTNLYQVYIYAKNWGKFRTGKITWLFMYTWITPCFSMIRGGNQLIVWDRSILSGNCIFSGFCCGFSFWRKKMYKTSRIRSPMYSIISLISITKMTARRPRTWIPVCIGNKSQQLCFCVLWFRYCRFSRTIILRY